MQACMVQKVQVRGDPEVFSVLDVFGFNVYLGEPLNVMKSNIIIAISFIKCLFHNTTS